MGSGSRLFTRGHWRSRLPATLLIALASLSAGFAPATAQGAGVLSIAVTLPDGSPAPNATIFLNDERVQAGSDGRWRGPLPGGGRIYEAAATPGFASRGVRWSDLGTIPASSQATLTLTDQLVSLFEASTDPTTCRAAPRQSSRSSSRIPG